MADRPMAEPLVYLDVDDEITSAAARIRAAEAESVTLVLPFGSRLATSRINFRLLAREATERGKRIELVTRRCLGAVARGRRRADGPSLRRGVRGRARRRRRRSTRRRAAPTAAAARTAPGAAATTAQGRRGQHDRAVDGVGASRRRHRVRRTSPSVASTSRMTPRRG